MTSNVQHFTSLGNLAHVIAQLLGLIYQGSKRSEHVVGIMPLGKQRVRLTLMAEVVDAGVNPLQTHGTLNSAKSGCDGSISQCGSAAECSTSPSATHRMPQLAPDEAVLVPVPKQIQRRRR